MDRTSLQQLAELRLKDAEVLLAAGQWEGTYYLLGYCVECALKACVAKQFLLHEVPERKLVNAFYTHNLHELLTIAGIRSELEKKSNADSAFGFSWSAVLDWSEAARYDVVVTETVARGLYNAVTDAASGILPWLKTQW